MHPDPQQPRFAGVRSPTNRRQVDYQRRQYIVDIREIEIPLIALRFWRALLHETLLKKMHLTLISRSVSRRVLGKSTQRPPHRNFSQGANRSAIARGSDKGRPFKC